MICKNVSVSDDGELLFAGQSTEGLAKKYGTPLYLMDEDRIRENCRTYISAANEAFGGNFMIFYASKAASFVRMYEIMREEGMGADVVSSGELYTALRAGFPAEKLCFHSNNKTDEDIAFAIENRVGFFAVDNEEELYAVAREAKAKRIKQKILLRLTPGIDSHTYEAVSTGHVDSKFGTAIETGQAEILTEKALKLPSVSLAGFHCHVGSQVFDSDVYIRTAEIMLEYIGLVRKKYGFVTEILNLGGGYGVRYTEEQPTIDIAANIAQVGKFISEKTKELGIPMPTVCMEPGRSIAADAGMTLYTAGTVKNIKGYKTYVSVDGGMTDNVRYAMYKAPYTVLPVREGNSGCMTADIVGRCCESGDVLQREVKLPSDIKRGDLIAFLTTGAYHYSMASNYNRIPRPPVVMLSEGKDRLAVRRETAQDLVSLDVISDDKITV